MNQTFEQITGMDIIGDEERSLLLEKQKEFNNQSYGELREHVLELLLLKKRRGASELLVQRIKSENHIYTTRDDIKSEMWIYDHGIYKPQGKSYIREFCRKILHANYTPQICNEVISKIEAETFIEQEEFFQNKYVDEIPVQNGILNVRTKKLLSFDPGKIFFNKLPVEYNPKAECPSIDKFLREILSSEEDVKVAYEVTGSLLYKEYTFEKAVMGVGGGRNGKSKWIELQKKLLGAENTCSIPLNQMKPDNSSMCELHGRLVNIAGDLSNTDLKETGCLKQTIGRDTIQVHRKFLRDLIFVNYAKHIFACNELPRVYDTTDGFWDKWVLLLFPYKFVTKEEYNEAEDKSKLKIKDVAIIEKITTPEELSGFLNKSLEGLDRLFENENYSQTKGTKDIKDFWIRNSDSFASFCIDNIEEDYESYITKKDLRKRYSKYCKEHRVKGTSDQSIKITLMDRFGAIDNRKNIDFENKHIWEGIKFKENL